ncbi:MAG: nucleotidyl transferase AbiEii/AbiGii toxin family protein [Patescibacteria group bacterium]
MVTRSQVGVVSLEELKLDCVPKATRKAFLHARKFDFLKSKSWYLAGGTALALQVGHRKSVDLDFFTTKKNFAVEQIERILFEEGNWVTTHKEKGTLYGLLHNAKMSFIAYPFFRPSHKRLRFGAIGILLPDDIAAMKIIAVSQRGRKRDFLDLYWYAHFHGTLGDALRRAVAQYPDQKHSITHFLKSLTYFDDAEGDPMPEIYFKADWKAVKAYFRREIPKIMRELLRL